MKYVNFGNSGVKVSRIALGLGLRGQSDASEAEKLIRSSIDLGINLIDCANVYGLLDDRINSGSSEKILGKVLVEPYKTLYNKIVEAKNAILNKIVKLSILSNPSFQNF